MILVLNMKTIEIINILKSDKIVKKSFLGVFPIDLLPDIIYFPSSMIVNLDPKTLPGSHWVSLYFNVNKVCEYFDSYGFPPNPILKEYILKNSVSFVYNNRQVQRLFTATCGQMCIYFLIWRCREIPFKSIIATLNKHYADEFITGFVNGLFRVNTEVYNINQLSKIFINNNNN